MQRPFPGWLMGGMAALLAAFALLSGWWPLQALGGLREGLEADLPQPWRASAPPETLGERLLPAVFFLAAAVLVAAVTLYTLAALGLW